MVIGIHPIKEALESGVDLDKVFVQQHLKSDAISEVCESLRHHGYHYQTVPIHKLNRLTSKNHQGVVAFRSSVTFSNLEELVFSAFEQGETPCVVVLDRITDVRNFGAIARTAECLGCTGLVIPSSNTAQVGEDAMKTSAGALMHIPVCKVGHLPDAVEYLKSSGLQIIGCTEKGAIPIYEADLSGPCAIVMGSEDQGISKSILEKCDSKVLVPMTGKIQSLNVSVAAGMLLSELARQRSTVG